MLIGNVGLEMTERGGVTDVRTENKNRGRSLTKIKKICSCFGWDFGAGRLIRELRKGLSMERSVDAGRVRRKCGEEPEKGDVWEEARD